jgi:hypothetical protein
MNSNQKPNPLFMFAAMLLAGTLSAAAQHGHLNAGALGQNQGDPLYFANGEDFVLSSGYVKTLVHTNDGRFAGYYEGGITPTVLPATANTGGPDPDAPALGSFIEMELASVEGPPGGMFSFWENGATEPTVSLISGETGTNRWDLSDSDGSPGSDPFGHIHGRRFTATLPGLYRVGFRLFDVSTNGAEGDPIHTPSELLEVHFQAGVTITSVVQNAGSAEITFGAAANRTLTVEASTDLGDADAWTVVGEPVTGDDHFPTVRDSDAAHGSRFYRVRDTSP